MGKLSTSGLGAEDAAINVLTGSFTAAGQSAGISINGWGNLSLWGSYSATSLSLTLEKSYDGGTTWIQVSRDATGALAQWTSAPLGTAGGMSVQFYEPEMGVLYRVNLAGTSPTGTLNYRISQ